MKEEICPTLIMMIKVMTLKSELKIMFHIKFHMKCTLLQIYIGLHIMQKAIILEELIRILILTMMKEHTKKKHTTMSQLVSDGTRTILNYLVHYFT